MRDKKASNKLYYYYFNKSWFRSKYRPFHRWFRGWWFFSADFHFLFPASASEPPAPLLALLSPSSPPAPYLCMKDSDSDTILSWSNKKNWIFQNSTKCQENPWCHSRSCFLSNSILFSLAVVSHMDSWRTRFSFSTSLTRASAPTWQRWRRDDTVWLRCLFSCSRSLSCRTDRKSVKCRLWQTDQIKTIFEQLFFPDHTILEQEILGMSTFYYYLKGLLV